MGLCRSIPLSTKLEPDNLYKTDNLLELKITEYMELDKRIQLRPFNDNKLYGHWNYH